MRLVLSNLKRVVALSVAAGCAACALASAASDPFAEAYERHKRTTRRWSMHSQPVEILKEMPAVLAFVEEEMKKGGHESELVTLAQYTVECYDRARDFDTAVPLAERLFANEKANYSARLAAARYLAMKAVDERKDYAAADAYYAKLAALKPVNPFMGPDIARHRAYLYTLRDDKAGAIAFLEGERAKLSERDTHGRGLYDDRIAGVYDAFFDYAGKLAFWRQRGNRRGMFKTLTSGEVSDGALCAKLAREMVMEETAIANRRDAWAWLWERDTPFCQANLAKVLDGTAASTNALLDVLAQKFTITNAHCPQMTSAPAWCMDWPCVAETWNLYVRLGRAVGRDVKFDAAQYAAIAFAGLRDLPKAREAVQEGLKAAALKDEERYELGMMGVVAGLKGDAESAAAALKEAEQQTFGACRSGDKSSLTEQERKKRFERAGVLAVLSCDDALARGVAKFYREVMDPVPSRKSYTVKFTDRNVAGAGDWANIPFKPEESDFDRKFGGPGMAFMTTDVATGDRGNAVKGGEKVREHPTTLQAVADEWGVHLLYTFYDRRARQFESGELDAGSFESYIAAGDNQPYTCFLCGLKKRARVGVMNTTYDTPGHRRIDASDPQQVRSETLFTDDAVLHYTAFSWDVFAERVPADGGTWDFESVFWGPVPCAWNGTASIHGRSTWGLLRFELGDAARVKILRQQLFRAVGLYKAEKTPGGTFSGSPQEGVFDHWQDDGVGDPAFYDKCLKTLVAELDAAAERVKVGMTDADVRDLAEKYLSRFLNVRFEVARLRSEYLRETL